MFQFFFFFGFFSFYNGIENSNIKRKNASQPPTIKTGERITAIFRNWGISWKWLLLSMILIYFSFRLQRLTAVFVISVLFYLLTMTFFTHYNKGLTQLVRSKYFIGLSSLTVLGFAGLFAIPDLFALVKELISFTPDWAREWRFNPLYYVTFLSSAPVFPIGVFLLIGSVQILTRKNQPGFYTLICTAVPLFILSFIHTKVRGTRYIINLFPLIVLIASISLNNLLESESKKLSELLSANNLSKYRAVISACLVFLILLAFSAPWVHYGYRVTSDYYHKEAQLALHHRNWRQACEYISRFSKPGDKLITSEPLTAHYYNCGEIDYYIRTSVGDFGNLILKDSKQLDDMESLKEVLSNNPRVWLILDTDRLRTSHTMPRELREFLIENLSYRTTSPDGTISIFSSNKENTGGI
jgi:hypothetical protein